MTDDTSKELLAALKLALWQIERMDFGSEPDEADSDNPVESICVVLRAAVAKAEGQS